MTQPLKSKLFFAALLSICAVALPYSSFSLAQDSPATQQNAPGPSDPQIAAIVVASNDVDIEAGKLAKSKTKNKEVKKLAQHMVTDHKAVNKESKALVKRLNVTPEENDTSKSLKANGKQTLAELKKLKGPAFDHAYVANEVTYHQTVLDSIDKTLLPSAKNPELKALLEKVRPSIAQHLEHAKAVQASLQPTEHHSTQG